MAHLSIGLTYVNEPNLERVPDARLAEIKELKSNVAWGSTLRFDCEPKNIDPPFTDDGTEEGLPKMKYKYNLRGKGEGGAWAHKSKKYVDGEGPLDIRRESRFYETHGTAIWFKIPKALEDYQQHKLEVWGEYEHEGKVIKSEVVTVLVS